MCGLCGCSEENHLDHHEHEITAPLLHHHDHEVIQIEQDLLAKNNRFASANREYFLKKKIKALNFMSSPGSGKTTLLSRSIAALKEQIDIAVIVGDQQTDFDAEKLRAAGANTIQVNTGKLCHLDAHMIGHSIEDLSPNEHSVLFIENVGNLVCPAVFDLGEVQRIVLLSVTEGDNKPLKYPDMFRTADLMILSKVDLLPFVDFDTDRCIDYARRINPSIHVLSLSATTGTGLTPWYDWLKNPLVDIGPNDA